MPQTRELFIPQMLNLQAIGGRPIIRQGDAVEELARLAEETRAGAIYFHRDPDPFGRAVEQQLFALGKKLGIEIVDHKDVCVHERDEVLTGQGTPFRVFTPYANAWGKLPKPEPRGRLRQLKTPAKIASLPLPSLGTWSLAEEGGVLPAGEKAARDRLAKFFRSAVEIYDQARDFPAADGTSRLSQDLRFGLISIRELVKKCRDHGGRGARKFLGELVWREFYLNILWHFPHVLEEEFNPVYRGMAWPGSKQHFEKWGAGETGFPLVDAAMRDLHTTGFMPNRLRMITAMFLTKDLHLDWRLGEHYFLQKLTDGEIGSNNGGWQWSAGTGADAAPYFRIQNPWTQSKRYDPDGDYIRRWLPELRDVPPARLHVPPPDGSPLAKNYPAPIVDHAQAREAALDLYHRARA